MSLLMNHKPFGFTSRGKFGFKINEEKDYFTTFLLLGALGREMIPFS